ncbi:MAG: type I DNA topoisomerase [Clostridiales bacterium]|nr:type I DNA topoisomerase [Clostridiales bacterium]
MDTAKNLVIVESPSKAKTIGKFLGSKYKVIASVGHLRDLPKSRIGIDIENEFEPQYISIRGKGDIIKELKKEAKKANKVYLATDPDREGEAISWHIANLLNIDLQEECRIVFNEITKTAIQKAIKNPRKIDLKLVDAQQARRVLDRLVGYQISPLLWRKLQRGLSAGRVQSAALRMICDREDAIKEFVADEYWNIVATLSKETSDKKIKEKNKFDAKLVKISGEKSVVSNEKSAKTIEKELAKGDYKVSSIEKKEKISNPHAPFTTSSLQQDAANKLGFSTKKTMIVAQQLYEGVLIPTRGTLGLLTYIRTDSVRISDEARQSAKNYIIEKFGEKYYAGAVYSNKKKDVQDAHEAIRPSHIDLTPDELYSVISKDQYNLYKLVWNRFIASQMSKAVYDSTAVNIENGKYSFRASGSVVKFDGYLKVYRNENDTENKMPNVEKGDLLSLLNLNLEQCFTQPPSRYTEASLVKDLEEKDIGRPSTYAPIIATLAQRKYITKEKKSILPTDLGFLVTDLMKSYFNEIVDVGFTAQMEDKLDDIEVKDANWKKIIEEFYAIFSKSLKVADEQIEKVEIPDEPTGEICEICGKPMLKKNGRFGAFAACSGYPECKNTKPIVQKIGVSCPKCGKDIIQKKGKSGKIFYGCSGYPDCDQVFWNKPTDKKCPECSSLMVEKKNKKTNFACSNPECGYKE